MKTIDQSCGAAGATVLRLALGTMWLAHALSKWFVYTLPGVAGWFTSLGLPGFMAWPVFLLELVAGITILLGLYGRYFSAIMIPQLLVVIWVHSANGWEHTSPGGGWEYPLFLVFASVAHVLIGDGRLALRSSTSLLPAHSN